jgi:predicted Zn-dependent protease
LALLLSSCASTHTTQQLAGERPDKTTDEAGLWMVMDQAEQQLKTSALIERSPELNAYVRSVVCRMAGDYCKDIRIYVIRQPQFNASMAPNGAMQVYTGLLLRAENEAQLAFVLGHEFGHYVARHTLQEWRAYKNAAAAGMFFGVVGALAGATSFYGFSREKEREADAYGFKAMTGAGYRAGECAALWRALVAETAHSDSEKTRKSETRASIFNTHPLTAERIATLDELAAAKGPEGDVGADRLQAARGPFLKSWMRDELRRQDFGESLFLIDTLLALGRDQGVLHYYKGEAHRLRRNSGDDDAAREAYQRAISFPDAPAEAWRELGDANLRASKTAEARAAFERYLAKAPDAEDRQIVVRQIAQLGGGNP